VSVFRELLAIKSFREGQAEIVVARERAALRDAARAHEEAQALLRRLLDEGLQAEHRLYRELCERIVRLRDIEDVQLAVAGLRQREAAQEDAVTAAERAEDKALQQLDGARAAHKEASRQKSKFVDLARNHADAMMREAERKEDLEMEEAASVRRDRDDWEHVETQEDER
jgi:type III secretion protein O